MCVKGTENILLFYHNRNHRPLNVVGSQSTKKTDTFVSASRGLATMKKFLD